MSSNVKLLLAVAGSVVLLLLLFAALTNGIMLGGMGSMVHSGMMSGGIFGLFFMLLFWGLVVTLLAALAVWVVGQIQRR